jgi:hypothetical protein
MTITRKYALHLIKSGRARKVGTVDGEIRRYVVLDRLDLQRTDHYPLRTGETN